MNTQYKEVQKTVLKEKESSRSAAAPLEENTKLPKIILYHILMYNRNNSIIAKNLKNINLKSATDDMTVT